MKIGELSAKTGLSIYTIRYYEKIGILKESKKDRSGRREYSADDVEWIKFIECLKATDMTLEEILQFISLRERGDQTIGERLALLSRRKGKLLEKIAVLHAHLEHIDYKIRHFEKILK